MEARKVRNIIYVQLCNSCTTHLIVKQQLLHLKFILNLRKSENINNCFLIVNLRRTAKFFSFFLLIFHSRLTKFIVIAFLSFIYCRQSYWLSFYSCSVLLLLANVWDIFFFQFNYEKIFLRWIFFFFCFK